jgi:hypothetical protein
VPTFRGGASIRTTIESGYHIQISERTRENGEDENGENTIGIAFVAKLEPGKKGLGNANRLGRSVLYIASKTSGEILREAGSR